MNSSTYRFDKTGQSVSIHEIEPLEGTRGILIHENPHGYGSTGVFDHAMFPTHALSGFDFFEYQKGETGEYFRVPLEDIVFGQAIVDPKPLEVRHAAWPGRDATEIKIDLQRQRARKIAKAIEQAKARQKREVEDRLRRAQEAKLEKKIADELEAEEGSVDAEIAQRLADMGLS